MFFFICSDSLHSSSLYQFAKTTPPLAPTQGVSSYGTPHYVSTSTLSQSFPSISPPSYFPSLPYNTCLPDYSIMPPRSYADTLPSYYTSPPSSSSSPESASEPLAYSPSLLSSSVSSLSNLANPCTTKNFQSNELQHCSESKHVTSNSNQCHSDVYPRHLPPSSCSMSPNNQVSNPLSPNSSISPSSLTPPSTSTTSNTIQFDNTFLSQLSSELPNSFMYNYDYNYSAYDTAPSTTSERSQCLYSTL